MILPTRTYLKMRKLTYLLLACVFFACNDTSDTPATTSAQAIVVNQPLALANSKKDTTKPGIKSRPRTMMDPARSVNDIDQAYPFDIALKDASGKLHNSADILKPNGKPTVVLYWLTTCYPCLLEMKAIQKEIDAWKAETDFNIVAISTDFEKNYGSFVKRVEESNWSFEAYVDVNREFRKVMPGALNGLPQSFIFDKYGEIAYHKRKYSTGDEHRLYAKVKELAAQ